MIPDSNIHAVIHLSSTAVYTVVGYFDVHHKKTKIMALGLANTDAFFGGQINNRQHLLSAIHKSVREAIDMAGLEMSYVGLSFASPMMLSQNGSGSKSIYDVQGNAGRAITHEDVRGILDDAKTNLLKDNRTAVQLCQQLFWLENESGVRDAIGMPATHLSINYHLMSIPTIFHAQVIDLLNSNNLEVHPVLFDGIVSSEYALTEEEKKQGICFIDIGAGTTKVCLYNDGLLIFTACLPVGGQLVDTDIAAELGLSLIEAESLKKHHGSAFAAGQSRSDFITLKKRQHGAERTLLLYELSSIIEARYLALFHDIFAELDAKGLRDFMPMGVVLAGGGSDMLDLSKLIERNFGVNVRKMGVNTKVGICTERLSDDNIKVLKTHIENPKLHSVIGALMYYQSEQYARDERGQFEEVERLGVFGRFAQRCQNLLDALKKFM